MWIRGLALARLGDVAVIERKTADRGPSGEEGVGRLAFGLVLQLRRHRVLVGLLQGGEALGDESFSPEALSLRPSSASGARAFLLDAFLRPSVCNASATRRALLLARSQPLSRAAWNEVQLEVFVHSPESALLTLALEPRFSSPFSLFASRASSLPEKAASSDGESAWFLTGVPCIDALHPLRVGDSLVLSGGAPRENKTETLRVLLGACLDDPRSGAVVWSVQGRTREELDAELKRLRSALAQRRETSPGAVPPARPPRRLTIVFVQKAAFDADAPSEFVAAFLAKRLAESSRRQHGGGTPRAALFCSGVERLVVAQNQLYDEEKTSSLQEGPSYAYPVARPLERLAEGASTESDVFTRVFCVDAPTRRKREADGSWSATDAAEKALVSSATASLPLAGEKDTSESLDNWREFLRTSPFNALALEAVSPFVPGEEQDISRRVCKEVFLPASAVEAAQTLEGRCCSVGKNAMQTLGRGGAAIALPLLLRLAAAAFVSSQRRLASVEESLSLRESLRLFTDDWEREDLESLRRARAILVSTFFRGTPSAFALLLLLRACTVLFFPAGNGSRGEEEVASFGESLVETFSLRFPQTAQALRRELLEGDSANRSSASRAAMLERLVLLRTLDRQLATLGKTLPLSGSDAL